jgi:hypothetical protein
MHGVPWPLRRDKANLCSGAPDLRTGGSVSGECTRAGDIATSLATMAPLRLPERLPTRHTSVFEIDFA